MAKEFIETPEQAAKLTEMLNSLKSVKGPIMKALQRAQDIYGYLPFEVQNRIADFFGVPLEDIYGVATFYSQFHLEPRGKYTVGVCMGTACYVRGAGKIIDKFKEKLSLEPGQTSDDMKYTLEATRCIGCCGLAPVLTVNDAVYGQVTEKDVEDIIAKYHE